MAMQLEECPMLFTWIGSDGDFSDGNNWEDGEGNIGAAPGAGDDAQISAGTISGAGSVAQLDIDGPVTFTGAITVSSAILIDDGVPLTISDGGSLTFTANTFTVNPGGVRRIVLAQARRQRAIEADDATLMDGYYAFEAETGIRWTNGNAAVPSAYLRA
jgi:hypothetical protein